jgi:hypothetical protein
MGNTKQAADRIYISPVSLCIMLIRLLDMLKIMAESIVCRSHRYVHLMLAKVL